MKLKGSLILFFALIFWTDLAANREREPVAYTPIDSLLQWYGPLLMSTPNLANEEEAYSEEKINALFGELSSEFRMELNSDVYDYIRHYTTGQKSNFEVALSLESLYQDVILSRIIERNMPKELALLPLALSGMHNQSVNELGGAGLWSINYYVGLKRGLLITPFIDERMDPAKSTDLALEYLNELYLKYKSWNLAITAFATSPGLVNKAIIHSGHKINYWDVVPFMPDYAKNIIPSFFASVYVATYYPEHDLNPPGIIINRNKEIMDLKEKVSLAVLSKELGVSKQTLRLLNPTLRGELIAPKALSGIDFYIPQGFMVQLTKVESAIYTESKKAAIPIKVIPTPPKIVIPAGSVKMIYTVQSGDFLGKIAEKHDVRVSAIKKWNRMRSDRINIGQKLTLYVNPKVANKKPSQNVSRPKAVTTVPAWKLITYTIKEGDTLWLIARDNPGNDIETIQKINNISSSIKPGQVIKIIKP